MTDAIDVEDQADDDQDEQAVPPACQWGAAGWCYTGRHSRCYFQRGPEGIGIYGRDDAGHHWVCACPCHENQGYAPCPGDHDGIQLHAAQEAEEPVQMNLF